MKRVHEGDRATLRHFIIDVLPGVPGIALLSRVSNIRCFFRYAFSVCSSVGEEWLDLLECVPLTGLMQLGEL